MSARGLPAAGSKPDKLMRDAIMLAVHREAADANGRPTQRLNLIAERLVNKDVAGDMAAIKEVIDRVDGKTTHRVGVAALTLEDFLDRIAEKRSAG